MKTLSSLILASALFAACSGESQRDADEREGNRQLAAARALYAQGCYDAARDTIMALRNDHPLAVASRKQAILLLDSIELRAAQDSLNALLAQPVDTAPTTFVDVPEQERLSIKVQFFERKIQEDLKKQ